MSPQPVSLQSRLQQATSEPPQTASAATSETAQAPRPARPMRRKKFYRQLARVLRQQTAQPLYLVIGATGSGKSSLIKHSDAASQLLLHGAELQLSLSQQALLLEVSPRLATAGWLNLLQQLKAMRPELPLNGLIITQAITPLLPLDAIRLKLELTAIQQSVAYAQLTLDMQLPVYLLFTHCESLAGFKPFFSGLPASIRQALWGINFPAGCSRQVSGLQQQFQAIFQTLLAPLYQALPSSLAAQQTCQERALTLDFPAHFAKLGQQVRHYLRLLCLPKDKQPAIELRGAYFGSLAAADTPFFTQRLLSQAILPESRQAASPSATRKKPWRCLLTASLCSLVLLALLATGYQHARQTLSNTLQANASLSQLARQGFVPDRPKSMLALLKASQAQPAWHGVYWPPLLWHDAAQRLPLQARAQYGRVLRRLLEPYLLGRLAQVMSDPNAAINHRRQALRLYLMLGKPEQFAPDELLNWLQKDSTTANAPVAQQALQPYVHDGLKHAFFLQASALDHGLIARTRYQLSQPIGPFSVPQLASQN